MFPLESALLPNEELPLRIFEPRYRDLVSDCLRGDRRFGVVLIARGREVGGGDERCDVGVLATITEHRKLGLGRYVLRSRMGERLRVAEWLPDDPYPRAAAAIWPDEPGPPVGAAALSEVEDRGYALLERIATARGLRLPARELMFSGTGEAGKRLYSLATRIPIGPADRYAVLAAPSVADRLAVLHEAIDTLAAMVEFQLSE
ncbi:LON peptidase substrate-binding domain-containing protein [Mycobacterium sp. pUA109]|uniref:LON peptidase substrate-binding domain-containing protein n=1 Tax=Mycobacterium sp. pUA109 TaxID=3238982 RepID=UPI00351AD413